MEAQKVLKIVKGKLCVVKTKHHGHGRYSSIIKPLAQATEIYNDDECKLLFYYIANKIKGTLEVFPQPVQKHLLDGADGYSHSYPMNEGVERCVKHIITTATKQSAYKETLGVSLGYLGPILYFNLIRGDGGVGFSPEFQFHQPIHFWDPKVPEIETTLRLELIGGHLCNIVHKDVQGLGKQHLEIVLAQGTRTYDDAECKQVFDYISRVLAMTLNIVSHKSEGWKYNDRMNENIEDCISNIKKHVGTSDVALDYGNGLIYFNAVDSNGDFI